MANVLIQLLLFIIHCLPATLNCCTYIHFYLVTFHPSWGCYNIMCEHVDTVCLLSNETGGSARKASIDETSRPPVVCTAFLCHKWWWSLWRLNLADIKSQEQMTYHQDELVIIIFVCTKRLLSIIIIITVINYYYCFLLFIVGILSSTQTHWIF